MYSLLMGLILTVALTGCGSSGPAVSAKYDSGYLDDYSELKSAKDHPYLEYWVSPALTPKSMVMDPKYTHFKIDPVVAYAPNHDPAAIQVQAASLLTQELTDEAKSQNKLASEAGSGVGVVKLAITRLIRINKHMSAWDLVPVRLIIDTSKDLAGDNTLLLVVLEGSLLDSETMKPVTTVVINLVGPGDGSVKDPIKLDSVKTILKKWVSGGYDLPFNSYLLPTQPM